MYVNYLINWKQLDYHTTNVSNKPDISVQLEEKNGHVFIRYWKVRLNFRNDKLFMISDCSQYGRCESAVGEAGLQETGDPSGGGNIYKREMRSF